MSGLHTTAYISLDIRYFVQLKTQSFMGSVSKILDLLSLTYKEGDKHSSN